MTDQNPMNEFKALSREHMRLVWQTAQAGGKLDEEGRLTARIMAEHPEYVHLWDRLDRLSDAEITKDGTNPILHITTHGIIENQIAAGEPPEVARVVDALVARGLPRHEAIHHAGMAFMDEFWHVMSERRPYDQARYRRMLLELLEPVPAHPREQAKARQRRNPKRRR